jgi:carboxyl-terminal processing protease
MNSRLRFLFVAASALLAVLLVVGSVMGGSTPQEGPYRHLAVFTEVLSRIKSEYVEEPDMKSVTLGALNGLLEAVDPGASYLSAEQYKTYLKSQESHKADVGLVLVRRYGYVGIVDAIDGSPAAKAGLTTGDVLEAIQGVSTRDMPLAYAEHLLRGAAGTSVEVSVLRARRPEPQKITLTRATVEYPAVIAKMLGGQTGYIEAESLAGTRAAETIQAAKTLEQQGAKKLILDLRHTATGTPEEGMAVANAFLDKGLITYLQGQKYPRQNFDADPAKKVISLPLAVLTNRGTAGGAEVAAAALLDDKRAQVVGERTYGYAALRRAITMDDGSAIILAVAKYYSPSGKAIQDGGVTPSVLSVEAEPFTDTDEEEGAPAKPARVEPAKPTEEDPVVKKAIEVLDGGPAQSAANPARAQGSSAVPDTFHKPRL